MNGVGNAIAGGWAMNGILYLRLRHSHCLSDSWICRLLLQSARQSGLQPFERIRPGCEAMGEQQLFRVSITASLFSSRDRPCLCSDSARAMGARNVDLCGVYKNFKLKDTMVIRIDASSYNVTNKPQFGMPTVQSMTASGGAPFGALTSTINTPRQFQFGARFNF